MVREWGGAVKKFCWRPGEGSYAVEKAIGSVKW